MSEALLAIDRTQDKPSWLLRTRVLAPYWKIVGARYLERMVRLMEISRKSYLEARPEIEAQVNELKTKKPVWDLLSILLLPFLACLVTQPN